MPDASLTFSMTRGKYTTWLSKSLSVSMLVVYRSVVDAGYIFDLSCSGVKNDKQRTPNASRQAEKLGSEK